MSNSPTPIEWPSVATMPAMVTPFNADETVNYNAVSDLVDWTIKNGVHGLVPCGTTGEFASLSRDERQKVIETTVEAADERVPIVAGAGATTVDDVLEFIDDASAAGADAALVPPPYYHAANAPAGNQVFFERVAEATALPVYIYNIPSCTGGPVSVKTVTELAAHEAIHGIKDTSGDFSTIERLISETPESFNVFQGYDDHFLGAAVMGSDGGINGLAGIFPKALRELCEAIVIEDFDRAREIQRHILSPVFEACFGHGFSAGAKLALVERGIIDDATVRPPLVELDGDAKTDVTAAVENAVSTLDK